MTDLRYGIFTKAHHVEKIVNYLNQYTDLNYIISSVRHEIFAYDFDIGISYCFPYKIDINYPKPGKRIWYNYHPAPLPKYAGLTNYAYSIRDKMKEGGVTVHVMTMDFDKGPIIKVKKFPLGSLVANSQELGDIAHYYLFQLFKETIEFLKYKPKNTIEFEKIVGK